MAWFGLADDPAIPKALMPEEYSSGFRRGQEFGYGELEETRKLNEQQSKLAAMLQAQAEGKAPSIAEKQFAQALEQSQAATASQLASARGMSPAQAQQLLMTRQAAAQQGAAGQSALLRLQEQQAAQALLGQALTLQRQQQILGASTAGQLAGRAGEMGVTQQNLEQQRLMREYEQKMGGQKQTEKGIATTGGALLGGLLGSLAGPGGTMAGAKLGAMAGEAIGSARGREMPREIPGHARFGGDTRSNDTVPAMLSPGEIVLPRSVAQAENAPDKAKKFVEEIKKRKKPTPKDFTQALSRLQELEARINAMETLADLEAESRG